MNEMTSAGPAPTRIPPPFGPNCPAAAEPIDPKIPAPITAPIASMIRSPAPSDRFSEFGCPSSAIRSAIGLRAKSDGIRARAGRRSEEQRGEHERDRAEQLHE